MKPTVTRGATHNFQAPENWQPETDGQCGDLQVRAEGFGERNIVELFSTWKPSPSELALLHVGGVIEVGLCLVTQPVMQVRVVEPVEPSLIRYVSHEGTADADVQEAYIIREGDTSFYVQPNTERTITINEDAHGHG